jgi:undecaprenyl diphosphate synthase
MVTRVVPRHVAIIMDGNSRWARSRGRPHGFGHRAGVSALRRVLTACERFGVYALSVYAFSTENWTRPRSEVWGLMRLFNEAIQRELDDLQARGIRVLVSGRLSELPGYLRKRIAAAEAHTAANRRGVLNICFNYGGRAEIVDACRALAAARVPPEKIDEEAISSHLYHPELPPLDLLIRTAGERRLSNFLLWEAAYAEIYVTEKLWPDFDEEDLRAAILDYQSRIRRFGGHPKEEAG